MLAAASSASHCWQQSLPSSVQHFHQAAFVIMLRALVGMMPGSSALMQGLLRDAGAHILEGSGSESS